MHETFCSLDPKIVLKKMEVEKKHVELIQLAIQRLIEEKREERKFSSPDHFMIHDDDEEAHQLLSKLLSQLKSLKENPKQTKPLPETMEPEILEPEDMDGKDETDGQEVIAGTKEILQELREVQRQNSVTHWLLSAMITVTACWQLSEVSLFLAVRSKLSHPFKAVGRMISGALQSGLKEPDSSKTAVNSKNSQIECPSLPPLKMPKLPPVDLPSL